MVRQQSLHSPLAESLLGLLAEDEVTRMPKTPFLPSKRLQARAPGVLVANQKPEQHAHGIPWSLH